MTRARGRLRRPLGLLASVLLACGSGDVPVPVVTDALGLLDPEEREALGRHHAVLLRDHDIDYRIDVARAGDLLAYGVRRFEALDVGSRSETGRGLLLVLDPLQDRVRLEVGQDLEGVYTDGFVAYLQERQMVHFFREGRIADGILATTELVVTRAQEAEAGQAFSPPRREGAAGGGAETRARLGAGDEERLAAGPDVRAREAPEQTVAAYLEAMAARNGNRALDLYSRETRELLQGWAVTPAQMDHVVRAYRHCEAESARVDADGVRAVVRYPPGARLCAPWLLVREAQRWRLDLATAQRVLRFGAGNAWHFVPGADHPYAFAFHDWRFDARGFPHAH